VLTGLGLGRGDRYGASTADTSAVDNLFALTKTTGAA
jgi:hypothetical protein